jgi:hypothetical protein
MARIKYYDAHSGSWQYADTKGDTTYTLPIATPETLGGVKPVAKTDDMTQSVGVDAAGGLWSAAGGSGGEVVYEATITEPCLIFEDTLTEEVSNKISKAFLVIVYVKVCRDTTDTETTTSGSISIAIKGGYLMSQYVSAIPAPTTTWMGYIETIAIAFQGARLGGGDNVPVITMRNKHNQSAETPQLVYGALENWNKDQRTVKITGSQNLGEGTTIKISVI